MRGVVNNSRWDTGITGQAGSAYPIYIPDAAGGKFLYAKVTFSVSGQRLTPTAVNTVKGGRCYYGSVRYYGDGGYYGGQDIELSTRIRYGGQPSQP